jgi:hypothetical protein
MTAPEPRSTGIDSNARGLVVIVVAVVVGVLLLANAGGGGGSGADTPPSSSPVTTADLGGTATTDATTSTTAAPAGRAPSEVKVLVLNGGGPSGAAGATSTTIGNAGYTMGEPANSPVTVSATTFFYAADYQSEATAIALLLGKSPDALEPLVDAGLGGAQGDASVVVVLGPDTPPVSTTTVPAAGN